MRYSKKQSEFVEKRNAAHVEDPYPTDATRQVEATLPPAFASADAETARYLDPTVVIDEATNRRVKRMIDRRILPFLIVTYFMQTWDKGTLASSSVMGIQTDANLKGQDYSLLGTILYIGILIGELPVNQLIQRVRVAKLLGGLVTCWGAIVCLHAACTTFSSLMAVRFFLGLCESGVQPALMTLTVMYYRRTEHPTIISYWYCQQGVQLIVAGLLSFGFLHIKDGPLFSWQALFLCVGGTTFLWGIAILLFLPDSPMRAKFWSDRDKTLIIERLRVNEQGVQQRQFKWPQFWEAIKDPVIWVYLLLQISSFIIVNGLSTFANIIVRGLGFTPYQTQLLNCAQGGWSILVFVGSAWLARITNQTILVLIIFMLVAMIGTIVLDSVAVTSKNAPGLLIAFYLANFVIVNGNLLWSIVTRNVAGQSKKTTVLTLMFIFYAVGAIIGPQVFVASDAPRYHNAFAAHIALYVFFIIMCVILRVLLVRRNKERQKAHDSANAQQTTHANAFADLTDRENAKTFRYMI